MKQVIYSEHHKGLKEYPLMEKPGFMNYPKFEDYLEAQAAYNLWLSSPPIAIVRDEDIEYASVVRPISDYEIKVRAVKCSSSIFWYKNRLNECFEFEEYDNGYKVAHGVPDFGTGYAYIQYEDGELVAIPKEGNSAPNKVLLSDSLASHSCTVGNYTGQEKPFAFVIKTIVHNNDHLRGMIDIDSEEYCFHYCDIDNVLEGLQISRKDVWLEERLKVYMRSMADAARGINALLNSEQSAQVSDTTTDHSSNEVD